MENFKISDVLSRMQCVIILDEWGIEQCSGEVTELIKLWNEFGFDKSTGEIMQKNDIHAKKLIDFILLILDL